MQCLPPTQTSTEVSENRPDIIDTTALKQSFLSTNKMFYPGTTSDAKASTTTTENVETEITSLIGL